MEIPEEIRKKLFSHGFTIRKGGHGFGLHASALAARISSVTLKLRHAPGASERLKVRNTPSFEATLQTDKVEQGTESSPLVESQAVLVIRRRPRTKGSYATVDLELDGERRSLKFKLEKP